MTTEQTLKEIDEIVALKIEIDWDKMADRVQTGLDKIKLEEIEERMKVMTNVPMIFQLLVKEIN